MAVKPIRERDMILERSLFSILIEKLFTRSEFNSSRHHNHIRVLGEYSQVKREEHGYDISPRFCKCMDTRLTRARRVY